MSFIEFIGGAERVDVYKHLESFDNRLTSIQCKILDICKRLDDLESKAETISSNIRKLEDKFENYRNLHPLTEEANSRIAQIELMQESMQYNNGKMMNDISDLKKELYNLYQNDITTHDVMEEKVIHNNNNTPLIDILDDLFGDNISSQQKATFVRMQKANGLETLQDLLDIPYENLGDLDFCGAKNLAILQYIYEVYE